MLAWQQQLEILREIVAAKFFGGDVSAIKPAVVEQRLGLSRNKWRVWLGGQKPSADDFAKVARALGVSPQWLLLGEGSPYAVGENEEGKAPERALRPVPLVSLSEGDGEGWSKTTPMAVGASPVLMGENMLAVVASGESMVPAGIASGQICYCDPDQPVLEGDAVYVVRRDGLATIKLFSGDGQRPGTIRFSGWHPPDEHDHRKLFTLELDRDDVRQLVPVIYVRRRL